MDTVHRCLDPEIALDRSYTALELVEDLHSYRACNEGRRKWKTSFVVSIEAVKAVEDDEMTPQTMEDCDKEQREKMRKAREGDEIPRP